MAEEVEVELNVVKSKIKAPGGIARINDDLLPHLKVEKGSDIELYTKEKAIIVQLTADGVMEKDKISLRVPDMEKLNIKEDETVYLRAHETIGDALGDLKEKIIIKVKRKDEGEEEE